MHGDLKIEKTYSIDSAIWYAEATLNYTYAIYDSSFAYVSRESSTFSIDLNHNNTVNQNDLVAAYNSMVDSLEVQWDNIQSSTKHLMICDIIEIRHSVGHLDLEMISVMVYDNNAIYYSQFGQTEYWYAGNGLGMCGDSVGHHMGRNAATELEYKIMHPLVANVANVRVYHTNVTTYMNKEPWYYYYAPAPRKYRFYLYSTTYPGDVQCLPPDELNFYLSSQGIPYVIDDCDLDEEKEFCLIHVHWDFMVDLELYIEAHLLDLSYGERQETVVGASKL
jgi:hypothetical protein